MYRAPGCAARSCAQQRQGTSAGLGRRRATDAGASSCGDVRPDAHPGARGVMRVVRSATLCHTTAATLAARTPRSTARPRTGQAETVSGERPIVAPWQRDDRAHDPWRDDERSSCPRARSGTTDLPPSPMRDASRAVSARTRVRARRRIAPGTPGVSAVSWLSWAATNEADTRGPRRVTGGNDHGVICAQTTFQPHLSGGVRATRRPLVSSGYVARHASPAVRAPGCARPRQRTRRQVAPRAGRDDVLHHAIGGPGHPPPTRGSAIR